MAKRAKEAEASRSTYYRYADPAWAIDFVGLGAHVYTAQAPSKALSDSEGSSGPPSTSDLELTVAIDSGIDGELDGAHEAARYSRPVFLMLQGVLSFLTGETFTVFEFDRSFHVKLETQPKAQPVSVTSCVIDSIDHRASLTKLAQVLHSGGNKSIVVASALDRWRRAQHLSNHFTEEDTPMVEEIFLGFFHVLELLADEEFKSTETKLRERVRKFCNDLYADEFKQAGAGLTNLANRRAETIETLIADDLSVTTKIARLVSRHEPYPPRLRAFVARLVEIRNAIAHGRYVYQPKLTWPLPAFFSLHEDTEYMLPAIRIFAAHVIDLQCGSAIWTTRWEKLKTQMDPAPEDVRSYIGSGAVDNDPINTLLGGHPHGVTISSITALYFEDKIPLKLLEKGARRLLLKLRLSEQNAADVFPAAVFLADSADSPLAARCKRIVKKIVNMDWTGYSNPKDFLRFAEHKNKAALWYRSWIVSRVRRRPRRSATPSLGPNQKV